MGKSRKKIWHESSNQVSAEEVELEIKVSSPAKINITNKKLSSVKEKTDSAKEDSPDESQNANTSKSKMPMVEQETAGKGAETRDPQVEGDNQTPNNQAPTVNQAPPSTKQKENGENGKNDRIDCREQEIEIEPRWKQPAKQAWLCNLCPPNKNQLYLDRYNAPIYGNERNTQLAQHVLTNHSQCEYVVTAKGDRLWIDRQRATWWLNKKEK